MIEKDVLSLEGQELPLNETSEDTEQELQQQLENLQASYTRLAADFDNFRKRTQRQTQEVIARANENLLCQLLPVLDNFCIALDSLADESVLKGMTMIYEQLTGVLEAQGVKIIAAQGCVFDPLVHEAVSYAHCSDCDDNIIVEELRKGYMLGGKVIRPSAVKVNIKKEEEV